MTEKNTLWQWIPPTEQAFRSLVAALITAPVLTFPHFDKEFMVDCDASNMALGAVLSQTIQNKERAVMYAS